MTDLKELVEKEEVNDKYYLDDDNAILVQYNNEKQNYTMIHKRLVDNELVEVNRWTLNNYYYGGIHGVTVLDDLNIFQVQNGSGNFNALYDYIKGKFIVKQNTWGIVEAGRNNEYLKKYNGFLASFYLQSKYEEGDVYSYDNPITDETIVESYSVKDGYYYAILEKDGTIRGNKLFKGESFSKIKEIIDLDNYNSLEEFQQLRQKYCDDLKKERKFKHLLLIKTRNNGSISPYLDNEVANILKLKKKDE